MEPGQTVRAKMYVTKVDRDKGRIELLPVVSGSIENEEFFKFTPAGSLQLETINESAIAQFEEGKQYYVDITPAE